MHYDFQGLYNRGRHNKVADRLSSQRGEELAALALISFPSPYWIFEFKQSYQLSPKLIDVINMLQQGNQAPKRYALNQGILLRKGRLVIVPSSPFQNKILQYIHISPEARFLLA